MIKFGTGGFRGVIGDDFTKNNIQLTAQALANIAKSDKSKAPVVIGYDCRFMSDFFAAWMAEVLAGNGIKVLLCTNPVPTPVIMCATKERGHDYGIMITASHNPYYFNGVKLFQKSGIDADVEFTDRIEKEIGAIKAIASMPIASAKAKGLVEEFSNLENYLKNIKSFILPDIKKNNTRIVYDNMCGVGIFGLGPLIKDFGILADELNVNHDAFFNFLMPNPNEAALSGLKETVVKYRYDYGIATDSDGDRLGVIDERGQYVGSNDILGALYYYLVRHRGMKGDVVKNISTSILLDKLADKLGYECHEVDVGFKNVSSKLREVDALIGGESSGGLTVRNYLYGKDSVFAAALFMEMQIMMKKPVSEIINEVRDFAGHDFFFSEDTAHFEDKSVFEGFMSGALKPYGDLPVAVKVLGANVKYIFEDGSWSLLRASGTEPLLRIVAEAKNERAVRRLIDTISDYLKKK